MNLELSLWIGALIGGLIVAIIATSKGHSVAAVVLWFFFGALLFPVALTAILCAERVGNKNCPECAERIYFEARKCPFCQSEQVFEVN
jgi:hypothetical protein